MTYTSLLEDVRRYLERGGTADPDVFAQLPRLVEMAERRCARELKVQGFITAVTGTMAAGQSVYPKPDRWRDTVSITIGTGPALSRRKPIFSRGLEYLRAYWPDESETAQPEFYADYDFKHWLIAPTPAQPHPFEVIFYELPQLLDETNQTNWLTEFAPELLLYSTLLECAPFLKNDERIPVWENLYGRAAQAITNEDINKIVDRNSVRTET